MTWNRDEGEEEQKAGPGAELTYISLSERNVNYAPDHHQSIEHVPRVFKIALRQAGGLAMTIRHVAADHSTTFLHQLFNCIASTNITTSCVSKFTLDT